MTEGLRRHRRWIGVLTLGGAVLMLLLGETVLRKSSPAGFLLYYLVCLVLTVVTIIIALADAHANAQRTVQEQRELINSTIAELQQEIQQTGLREKSSNPEGLNSKQL